MIPGCISQYVFVDSKVEDASIVSAPLTSQVFYDVIRVKQGVPLFFEQHANRFFHSFVLAGFPYVIQKNELRKAIMTFISCENLLDGNIRIVYYHDAKPSFCIYQIAHSYPSNDMYIHGVSADFLFAERKDPNIKQELQVRNLANQEIQKRQVFDVVYVDEKQMVREGSRTNVFFVQDSKLITAPSEDVLCGITRANTIQVAEELHIDVIERKILLAEIPQFEAAFFTGTSPKILPISCIGTYTFATNNKLVQKLMAAYDKKIEHYIQSYTQSL